MTDKFLNKDRFQEDSQLFTPFSSDVGQIAANENAKLKVKIILRKSSRKILFALGKANLVDFVLCFLTFPLGAVENLLKGNSCLGSIDNLHKAVADLNASKSFLHNDLHNELIKAQVAPQFKLTNQILPVEEASQLSYSLSSDCTYLVTFRTNCDVKRVPHCPLTYVDPKSSGGFAKTPGMYMVTDDLFVTPSSYVSAVSFLNKSNFPSSDLEERAITIDQKEVIF